MNVLGRIFLNFRKDRQKGDFLKMRCRINYVPNNTYSSVLTLDLEARLNIFLKDDHWLEEED